MIPLIWGFLILIQIVYGQNCRVVGDCESCVAFKNRDDIRLCVWCRSNASCYPQLDPCPKDDTDPHESVLTLSRCSFRPDGEANFVLMNVFICILSFCSCMVAFIYVRHRQKKRKAKKDEVVTRKTIARKEKRKTKKKRKDRVKETKSIEIEIEYENSSSPNRSLKHSASKSISQSKKSVSRKKSSVKQKEVKWQVRSAKLRVREEPNSKATKVTPSLLKGDVIVQLTQRGNWIEHETGWSKITDGTGDDGVVYLSRDINLNISVDKSPRNSRKNSPRGSRKKSRDALQTPEDGKESHRRTSSKSKKKKT